MKKTLTFLVLLAFFSRTTVSAQAVVRTYKESDADFPNPERGFYRPTEAHASHYIPLSVAQLKSYQKQQQLPGASYEVAATLIYRGFILDSFIDKPIAPWYLEKVRADFATVRAAGLKVIVRFAYTNKTKSGTCADENKICPPYGDAPKAIVLHHIEQLKPVLEENADVIAVVQMGFIGIWGENYYTDYFGDASTNGLARVMDSSWQDRYEVLKKLLDALPKDRMVQVRTPQLKQRFVYGPSAPVTAAPLLVDEAFTASDKARIGFHNDCFLANADDYGTFYDYGNSTSARAPANDVLRAYFKEDSRFVAIGGETCDNAFSPQNDCAPAGHAVEEMRAMHYSYLNAAYNKEVLNDWQKGGCMDDIKRRLGYRFILHEAVLPKKASRGQQVTFVIRLENKGFASPFNPRPVEVILRNKQTGKEYILPSKADIRRWYPGKVQWQELFKIPISVPAGNYAVFINLPDQYATLRKRPEYSIRFANDRMWEATTGYNNLQHVISIH